MTSKGPFQPKALYDSVLFPEKPWQNYELYVTNSTWPYQYETGEQDMKYFLQIHSPSKYLSSWFSGEMFNSVVHRAYAQNAFSLSWGYFLKEGSIMS